MSPLDQIQKDIQDLPEEAQRMIMDFVEFLKQRYQTSPSQAFKPLSFESQSFVGMWSDRPEMHDSAAWVRQVRQQQWQR